MQNRGIAENMDESYLLKEVLQLTCQGIFHEMSFGDEENDSRLHQITSHTRHFRILNHFPILIELTRVCCQARNIASYTLFVRPRRNSQLKIKKILSLTFLSMDTNQTIIKNKLNLHVFWGEIVIIESMRYEVRLK